MRKVFVLLISLLFLVSNSLSLNELENNSTTINTTIPKIIDQQIIYNLQDEVAPFSAPSNSINPSNFSLSNSTRSLKKLIHIHRHGARTSERDGMQLTQNGKEQLVELGHFIFDKYSNRLSNFSQFFQDLQVYSTNYNRTIQSAEYFLLGLFDSLFSKTKQQGEVDISNFTSMIQIYKTNYNTDLLLNGWRQSECVKQKELIKIQVSSPFFKELFAFLLPIIQDISSVANAPLNNFYDAYLLYDELISSQVEGNLSEPLKLILSNETLYTTLSFMNDFSAIYTFYGSPLQVKITTQTLMQKIFEVFSSPSSPSFNVFSAHDITMDGVFVALNLTNPVCLLQKYFNQTNQFAEFDYPYEYSSLQQCLSSPQFAANIQIELYDDNSIAFIYNNATYDIPQLSSLEALTDFIQTYYENINSNQSCSSDHHKYLRHQLEEF